MTPGRKGGAKDGRGSDGWDVVLAEDNDDHALLIEMALERATTRPVAIRRARNGDEALELVEEVAPDLLLLDLKMPGRTGHEVLERIKGNEALRGIPVAVLTSSDRDEDIARSYGLGGNHFITKPDNPAELEERLRSLLKNLAELSGIRRGTKGMEATAVSAVSPESRTLRRIFTWSLLILVVAVLVLYGLSTGVIP